MWKGKNGHEWKVLRELVDAHDDISYMANTKSEYVFVIADLANMHKLLNGILNVPFDPSKKMELSIKHLSNSDYSFFPGRNKPEHEVVQCELLKTKIDDSIENSSLVLLDIIPMKYAISGKNANTQLYVFIQDLEEDKEIRDHVCICSQKKNINEMFRYFMPTKHSVLIVHGFNPTTITPPAYECLNNLKNGNILIGNIKYEGWNGSLVLIGDKDFDLYGFKNFKISQTSLISKSEEQKKTDELLDGLNFNTYNVGDCNSMLAEAITLTECEADYPVK